MCIRDRFNNEQLFFENYQYKFILREIEEYENVEIFVGDYSVPIQMCIRDRYYTVHICVCQVIHQTFYTQMCPIVIE